MVPDNEETILATMNLGVQGCRGAVPAVCWVSGFGIGMPDGPWGDVFFSEGSRSSSKKMDHVQKYVYLDIIFGSYLFQFHIILFQ